MHRENPVYGTVLQYCSVVHSGAGMTRSPSRIPSLWWCPPECIGGLKQVHPPTAFHMMQQNGSPIRLLGFNNAAAGEPFCDNFSARGEAGVVRLMIWDGIAPLSNHGLRLFQAKDNDSWIGYVLNPTT